MTDKNEYYKVRFPVYLGSVFGRAWVRTRSWFFRLRYRLRRFLPRHVWIAVAIILLIGVVVNWVDWSKPVFQIDFWIGDPEGVRNLVWTLATLFGAAIGVFGAWLAYHRTQASRTQARVAERSLVTDRFTRAIDHLASEELFARLGGIHALGQITKESEDDAIPILKTLAAFVKAGAPRVPDALGGYGTRQEEWLLDISQALETLMFVELDVDLSLDKVDLSGIDFRSFPGDAFCFSDTILNSCDFMGRDLSAALFSRSELRNASLRECECNLTNFDEVIFDRTDFENASFPTTIFDRSTFNSLLITNAYIGRSYLRQCVFTGVTFDGSDLHRCDFDGSTFGHTSFVNCDLSGAYLATATGLEASSFLDCRYHHANPPFLPSGLRPENIVGLSAHDDDH